LRMKNSERSHTDAYPAEVTLALCQAEYLMASGPGA
jgi:hypothetical protein